MKDLPVRKIIRLTGYDYTRAGCYFVTMCVKDRHELLSQIVGTTAPGRPVVPGYPVVPGRPDSPGHPTVQLTQIGQCVDETIQKANGRHIKIDKYVIMPNHIHMIVSIRQEPDDRGRDYGEPDDRGRSSLQQVVRNIKSYVSKQMGYSLWQPRFYDHIIRDEAEYLRIGQYIDENPARWREDRYYGKG